MNVPLTSPEKADENEFCSRVGVQGTSDQEVREGDTILFESEPILKSRIRESIREDTVTLAHVFGSEENAGDSTPCPRYTYMMAPNMT